MRRRPFLRNTFLSAAVLLAAALLIGRPALADMTVEFQNQSAHGVEWSATTQGPNALSAYSAAASTPLTGTNRFTVTRNGTPVCEGMATYTSIPPASGNCGYVVYRLRPDDPATGVGCSISTTTGLNCKVVVVVQALQ